MYLAIILIFLLCVFLITQSRQVETFSNSYCKTFCHNNQSNPDCLKRCPTCVKPTRNFRCPEGKTIDETANNGYGVMCDGGALEEDGVTPKKCTADLCCTVDITNTDDVDDNDSETDEDFHTDEDSSVHRRNRHQSRNTHHSHNRNHNHHNRNHRNSNEPHPDSSHGQYLQELRRSELENKRRQKRLRKFHKKYEKDTKKKKRDKLIQDNELEYIEYVNKKRNEHIHHENKLRSSITSEQNFMPNLSKLESQEPYQPSRTYTHRQPSERMAQESGWSYIPPYFWSVPQKRPPACIPQKGYEADIKPVLDMGVPLNALKYTEGGSILPKFEYKEKYNPNYYYPGWEAK